MKVVLANAFSLSMLAEDTTIKVRQVSVEEVKELIKNGFESAIGHESTAQFVSKLLGTEVPAERKMVKLDKDTTLIVFQLMKRLEEGKVLTEEEIREIPFKVFAVRMA